jgi:hypothetical protein
MKIKQLLSFGATMAVAATAVLAADTQNANNTSNLNLGADSNWLGLILINPGGAVIISGTNTLTLRAEISPGYEDRGGTS